MEQRILLVDDEADILEFISYNLIREGYQVYTATNGKEAVAKAREVVPHLILLDVMMPEMDGIETCQEIRKQDELKNTLIAFLTARGEDYSQIAGFEAGADDYIAKPFGMMELMARIRTALRHSGQGENGGRTYQVGALYVDPGRHVVRDGERDVTLTLKEFQLLCLLLERRGTVFTRDQLLNTFWGYEFDGASRTVDVHIRTLRQKLGEAGACIETVRGIGYKVSE